MLHQYSILYTIYNTIIRYKIHSYYVSFFLRARWTESSLVRAREGVSTKKAQLPKVMTWEMGSRSYRVGWMSRLHPTSSHG